MIKRRVLLAAGVSGGGAVAFDDGPPSDDDTSARVLSPRIVIRSEIGADETRRVFIETLLPKLASSPFGYANCSRGDTTLMVFP